MRLLGSFIFLVGALSVGAFAYFPTPLGSSHGLLEVVEIAGPDPRIQQIAPLRAGAQPVIVAEAALPEPASGAPQSAASRGTAAQAPISQPGQWRAIVTTADRTETSRAAGPAPAGSAAFYELARNLQRELQRVGCYAGEIDSDWGPGSRRAMSEFLTRINATLPVDKPDYILLTLLQGHVDQACGVSCPSGHGLTSDGRCVPNVIVADGPQSGSLLGQKTTGSRIQREWQQATSVARGDVAGAQTAPAPNATAKTTSEALPAIARAQGQEAAVASVRPLPGRMAIGAPPSDEVAIPPPVHPTSRPAVEVVAPPVAYRPAPPAHRSQPKTVAALEAPAPAEPAASSATAPIATPPPAPPRVTKARPRPDRPATARDVERTVRTAPRYARGDRGGMVRTSQGRVRRGSPQHNLMLSLGGVF